MNRPRAQGQTRTLTLPYRPPFDWAHLLGFLSARAIDGIEVCADGSYRRSLRLAVDGQHWRGRIHAIDRPGDRCVEVNCEPAPPAIAEALAARLRRLFDLDADPVRIAAALGPLAAGRPGLRLPGAVDGFEVAVRAVLGQQVSVKAARTLAGRIVARYGEPLDPVDGSEADAVTDASPSHSFPAAATLAALPLHEPDAGRDLRALGLTGARSRTLIGLARALDEGRIRLDADAEPEATMAALQALPGIGPWTAQYIAMRALSWPDAFPASDLGVMKALGARRPREVLARAEAWRPWRAYAVIHLWGGATP